MANRRLTQRFPFLLPLRRWQRKQCFYLAMRFDRNRYAQECAGTLLPFEVFSSSQVMVNEHSGYDIRYQYNKVHNLKLAAAGIHRLLIRPGETFSFWMRVRNADKKEPYRDGLVLVNGAITGSYGGGLCQLSNLLYWLFLHSPLTVTERHGHASESVAGAEGDQPFGTDATVSEGWCDLKVTNHTAHTYQISITFDDTSIYGTLLSDTSPDFSYEIYNPSVTYERKQGQIFQNASVTCRRIDRLTGRAEQIPLYDNRCQIGYPLPEGTIITEN